MSTPTKKHWRVEVLWQDSMVSQKGWQDIPTLLKDRKEIKCLSVGFVLADDGIGMVLASSVHGREAVGVVHIPRSAILKVKRVR